MGLLPSFGESQAECHFHPVSLHRRDSLCGLMEQGCLEAHSWVSRLAPGTGGTNTLNSAAGKASPVREDAQICVEVELHANWGGRPQEKGQPSPGVIVGMIPASPHPSLGPAFSGLPSDEKLKGPRAWAASAVCKRAVGKACWALTCSLPRKLPTSYQVDTLHAHPSLGLPTPNSQSPVSDPGSVPKTSYTKHQA